MRVSRVLLPVAVSSTLFLQACAPVIVGAAATGAYLAVQERGAKAAVQDTAIKTGIKDRLTNTNYKYLTNIGVHVLEGDVLLTGVAPNQEEVAKIKAEAAAENGVKQVFDEIIIADAYTTSEKASDTWIGTQLRTRLLGTKDVYSVNYITDVVKGHVYILGLAGSQSELERVLYVARTTKNVVEVHNYIRVVDAQ